MMGWFTRATAATTKRKIGSFNEPEVHGLIEHYGLTSWWLATFSRQERRAIEGSLTEGADYIINPHLWPMSILTHGHSEDGGRSVFQFLAALAVDARRAEMISDLKDICSRIDVHIRAMGGHVRSPLDVEQQSSEDEETYLLRLAGIEEEDSLVRGGLRSVWGAGYGPFEALAKLYRKRKDYAAEVAILERYLAAPRHHQASAQVTMRLARARELLKGEAR